MPTPRTAILAAKINTDKTFRAINNFWFRSPGMPRRWVGDEVGDELLRARGAPSGSRPCHSSTCDNTRVEPLLGVYLIKRGVSIFTRDDGQVNFGLICQILNYGKCVSFAVMLSHECVRCLCEHSWETSLLPFATMLHQEIQKLTATRW